MEIEGLKLTKSSHAKLLAAYKEIYGHEYDGTGAKFGVIADVSVLGGSVRVRFLNSGQFLKINKYVRKVIEVAAPARK